MTGHLITVDFNGEVFKDKPNLVKNLQKSVAQVSHSGIELLGYDGVALALYGVDENEDVNILSDGACEAHKVNEISFTIEPVEEEELQVLGFESPVSFEIPEDVYNLRTHVVVDGTGTCSLSIMDRDTEDTLLQYTGKLKTSFAFEPSFGLYPEEQFIVLYNLYISNNEGDLDEVRKQCKEFCINLASIKSSDELAGIVNDLNSVDNYDDLDGLLHEIIHLGAAVLDTQVVSN